jgi:murein DD-endopeptidase MepM/ murein hydrolase activator NlpD
VIAAAIVALSPPTDASAQGAFAGYWEPGSGVQWWQTGLTIDEFKAQDQAYFNQGLRLTVLEIKDGRFTGVWRPGSGAQHWQTGMSIDEFTAEDKNRFNQGLRLDILKSDGGTFAAVWRPGTGAQWWRAGMSVDELKAQDQTYFNQGLRLTALVMSGGKYMAVWRPGSGAQHWQTGMSASQFKTEDAARFTQGLRLQALDIDGGNFTAVWRPGNGEQRWISGTCFDDFKTTDQMFVDHGLRLSSVVLHDNPRALYKLPFADNPAWKLWNGNWDDPTHGHNQGNPNGLQAYAFDFGFDANNDGKGEPGQQIRAARDGTVYALVKTETGNSWGASNLCTNGVGNYLVIQHDDGTFGTYWHLSQNGVLVNLHDKVTQGQVIAISGNTGNSSTPHMHFDVRSGWDLKYSCSNLSESPNVKINFQDKNHSCWRPQAGQTLSSNN